jgi:guanylate kinase
MSLRKPGSNQKQISVSSLRGLNKTKPMIVVLSGPSGTGKSTIVDALLAQHRNFVESVSATTRERRRGERHKRDYFFLTHEQFRNKSRRGEFIETVRLFGEYYGTPKEFVESALERNKTILFDIDIRGGRAIKRWRKDAVLVFIMPPSTRVLEQRLRGRKSESDVSLKRRLARSLKEMKNWTKYDYVVCNDDLEQTVALIETIIRAESQKVERCGTISFPSEG